ncbi:MAG: hypothetical protein ACI8ZM_003935 [Crocinitomix sp.]|jgi:hypothetical protein
MRESFLKLYTSFLLAILTSVSFGQHDSSFEIIRNYFSIEELIKDTWVITDRIVETDSTYKSDLIPSNKDSISVISFFKGFCLYSHFIYKNGEKIPTPKISSYILVKDSISNTLNLHFLEKKSDTIRRTFQIEAYSFNRLILIESETDSTGFTKYSKITRSFERSPKQVDDSAGMWLHQGSFSICNLADTDTLAHKFDRVLRGQDVRDSLSIGDITFQIEFLFNETYFTFCTAGVLGSVNLGKCRIDMLNKRFYFLEKDDLVYDYYFNSDSELMLKLNQDLTSADN